jgi:hypothetical protein
MTRYERRGALLRLRLTPYIGKGDILGAYEVIHHSTTIHWLLDLALPKNVEQETEQ